MSDDVFYVGALDDNHQLSGFVPARFMTINGQPVADQTPGGPSGYIPYIYSDAQGSNKSDEANPNNYMIVPAGFNEAHARAYADQIRQTMNNPEGGVPFVLTKMFSISGAAARRICSAARNGESRKAPPYPPSQAEPHITWASSAV